MKQTLEASKAGMKVGRLKDPLYKDSYLGILPPTFTPPWEPIENSEEDKEALLTAGLPFAIQNPKASILSAKPELEIQLLLKQQPFRLASLSQNADFDVFLVDTMHASKDSRAAANTRKQPEPQRKQHEV